MLHNADSLQPANNRLLERHATNRIQNTNRIPSLKALEALQKFQIGDRVQHKDGRSEGVIFGAVWNPSMWNYSWDTWIYFVRWDKHPSYWLPTPHWDQDATSQDELIKILPG